MQARTKDLSATDANGSPLAFSPQRISVALSHSIQNKPCLFCSNPTTSDNNLCPECKERLSLD